MKRWLVWTIFVASWTLALEMPVPVPTGLAEDYWTATCRYVIAKSVHILMYALMTLLSSWVPLSCRYRVGLMFFLMAHAAATELLQEMLHEYFARGGSLMDVEFDHLGILLGLLASWKSWTRADADVASPPEPPGAIRLAAPRPQDQATR